MTPRQHWGFVRAHVARAIVVQIEPDYRGRYPGELHTALGMGIRAFGDATELCAILSAETDEGDELVVAHWVPRPARRGDS
jgi:hypothetical protein